MSSSSGDDSDSDAFATSHRETMALLASVGSPVAAAAAATAAARVDDSDSDGGGGEAAPKKRRTSTAAAAATTAAAAAAAAAAPAKTAGGARFKAKPIPNTLPLTLAASAATGMNMLLEVGAGGPGFEGDTGAVGRLSGAARGGDGDVALTIDLKGQQFAASVLPCATVMVVGVTATEAKIEAVLDDYVVIEHSRDLLEEHRDQAPAAYDSADSSDGGGGGGGGGGAGAKKAKKAPRKRPAAKRKK